jgi:hypothetical protein
MIKYKVIRSYDDGKVSTKDLQKAFDSGYEFLRASEYVPPTIHGSTLRYGYIEYILVKWVQDDRD